MPVVDDQAALFVRLANETDVTIDAVIQYHLNSYKLPELAQDAPSNRHQIVRLCEMTKDIKCRHSSLFDAMFDELQLNELTAYAKFAGVTDALFAGGIRWGRIVALLSFCGYVCCRCQHDGMESLVAGTSRWTKTMFRSALLGWMMEHGGWTGCHIHFNRWRNPMFHWNNIDWSFAAKALVLITVGGAIVSYMLT